MSVFMSDAISTCPASRSEHEKEETSLAATINDLAVLRFSIVVTAKWEVAESEDTERRTELRTELSNLRHLYFEKLDQIAMTFGVEQAMKAKEEVEGNFKTSREIKPAMTPSDAGPLYF
jgi:molecular chaperone DnaK (HSP70)